MGRAMMLMMMRKRGKTTARKAGLSKWKSGIFKKAKDAHVAVLILSPAAKHDSSSSSMNGILERLSLESKILEMGVPSSKLQAVESEKSIFSKEMDEKFELVRQMVIECLPSMNTKELERVEISLRAALSSLGRMKVGIIIC